MEGFEKSLSLWIKTFRRRYGDYPTEADKQIYKDGWEDSVLRAVGIVRNWPDRFGEPKTMAIDEVLEKIEAEIRREP